MCTGNHSSVYAERKISEPETWNSTGNCNGMYSFGWQNYEWIFIYNKSMDMGMFNVVFLYFCEDVSGIFRAYNKKEDNSGCCRVPVFCVFDFLSSFQREK